MVERPCYFCGGSVMLSPVHDRRYCLTCGEPQPRVYSKRSGTRQSARSVGPAVLIDRSTMWGNPFHIGKDGNRKEVIRKFTEWVWADEQLWLRQAARRNLRGHDLLCWCAPEDCHGDVWLVIANGQEDVPRQS